MTLLGLVATNRVVKTTGTQENKRIRVAYTTLEQDTIILFLDDSSQEIRCLVT